MITEFGKILLFLLIGLVIVAGAFIVAFLLRPKRWYRQKHSTYECGEEPIGSARVKFNVRFYVLALIFLIFEVEIVFLFPWALIYRELGMFAFLEMLVFLFILIVGFIYVWVRGDLGWDKPRPEIPSIERKIIPQAPQGPTPTSGVAN
jgi:NADH-quinone oxidoreductase subunit A